METWKLKKSAISKGSLKKVADEEPSGYIVTSSKDELKKLTDKLTGNNLMGWIDISKDGKEPKVIVLLFQPGYPELFGLFLPDANILTSHIEKLAPMQRPTSQKPAPASLENLGPTTALKTLKEPTDQDPTKDQEAESADRIARHELVKEQEVEAADRIARHELAKEQEAASATNQQKQTSPDLIPWWIFTGDLQN